MQAHKGKSYWSKNASKFDKNTNQDIRNLVNRIVNDIGHVDRALDVGAGTGVVSLELAKHVKQVDALDSELKMISMAKKKAGESNIKNISFHTQSAYELEYSNHIFDAIIILNSLHVMKTPALALLEARRVMKSKGLLIAPTYCHAETKENLNNYQKWSLKSGHKSHHLFTCESLCELISTCGFDIKTRDTTIINHERHSKSMALGYIVACPKIVVHAF